MGNPTYYQDATLKAATEARVPTADLDGGGNMAGSCAAGLGINIAGGALPDPSDGNWTLLDQAGAARTPQTSQHIGQDATAVNVTDNVAEFNDTATLTTLAAGWVQTTI